jgi:hypothetical protein
MRHAAKTRALIHPASPAVNQNEATVIPYGSTRTVGGVGEEMQKSALDQAVRDMMEAAGDLPVPDHLLKFVEDLEDHAEGEDPERRRARSTDR